MKLHLHLLVSSPKYGCSYCHHNLLKDYGKLASFPCSLTYSNFFNPHHSLVRQIKQGLMAFYQGKSQVH